MEANLALAINITLIGMGLVFGAILLLWALMALLVRFTSGATPAEESQIQQAQDRRRQAAAIAVAIALARQASSMEPHEFPLPPTAQVSPWQAVMRTRILNKRGPTR